MAPKSRLTVAGVTATDDKVGTGALTVIATVAVAEPLVAVIVALPAATAVTIPAELTVATPEAELAKVDVDVTFCVLPSLYVPVTVSVEVSGGVSDVGEAATEIDESVGVTGVDEPLLPPPHAANAKPEHARSANRRNRRRIFMM